MRICHICIVVASKGKVFYELNIFGVLSKIIQKKLITWQITVTYHVSILFNLTEYGLSPSHKYKKNPTLKISDGTKMKAENSILRGQHMEAWQKQVANSLNVVVKNDAKADANAKRRIFLAQTFANVAAKSSSFASNSFYFVHSRLTIVKMPSPSILSCII